jgi:plastocyanin
MEIKHILALLVVVMLSGCAANNVEQPDQGEENTPPAEDEQPPVEPEMPPVEPESPEEEEEESEEEAASGADIQILRGAFDPEEITVAPGSIVTFKNTDDRAHLVVVIGGERSPGLEDGDTFEHKFEEAGTYEVMDSIFGFKATIIVQE